MHRRSPRASSGLQAVSELLGKDVEGATAIEYGLIAALIAVALIGTLENLRDSLLALPMGTLMNAIAGALS